MKGFQQISGSTAHEKFPKVVGEIRTAWITSDGDAILEHGLAAYGVVCGGEYVACCPTFRHAERALISGIARQISMELRGESLAKVAP